MASFLENRWWIPFAACLGIMVGIASVLVLPFGVFIKPVSEEFGWSRAAMSSAPAISALFTIFSTPLQGRLLDHFGYRRVMLPGFILFTLFMSCLALISGPIWQFYVIYAVTSFVGTLSGPVAYSKAVASWFDRERGLALGIATSGAGLGTVVMPLIAQLLLSHFGWRSAYVGLAAISGVFGCLVVILFIREPPSFSATGPGSQVAVPGMTLGEAVRGSWRFWLLASVFFLGGITINGAIAHVVPLLTDRGMTPIAAASFLSASGLAAVTARLIGGWCLDRFYAPAITAFFFLIAAAGTLLLWSEAAGSAPFLGVLGLGVEIDAMGFLISRYFGLKSFGAIYGALFPAFVLGVGIGPFLMGLSFDRLNSYDPALMGFSLLLAVTALLVSALGPYTYPREASLRLQPATT